MTTVISRYPRTSRLAGWAAAGLVYFLAVLPFYTGTIPKMVGFKAVWAVIGWGLSEGLLRIYRKAELTRGDLGRAARWTLGASVLVGGAWVAAMTGVSLFVQGNTLLFFTPSFFPFVLMNHVFIVMAWSGGYLSLSYGRRAQADQTRLLEAESAARAAKLELLRLQLSPHFLFNSLASLRALIPEDPDAAREMVTRLSRFLRYALASGDRPWVPIREEIDVLGSYLEIERTRFSERLDVEMSCDPEASDELVPSLLLLSLVENAVKHGEEVGGTLRVDLRARRNGDGLILEVTNSGALRPESLERPDSGFGLRNLEERLRSAYGDRANFTLEEREGTVRARITVEP